MIRGEQRTTQTQIQLAGPAPSADPADIMHMSVNWPEGQSYHSARTMRGEGHSTHESEKLQYELFGHQ